MATILIIFVRINWLNSAKIAPIIQWIPCALLVVQKCLPPKKYGDKTQGIPSTSKSRGTYPPVYPRIYAHCRYMRDENILELNSCTRNNFISRHGNLPEIISELFHRMSVAVVCISALVWRHSTIALLTGRRILHNCIFSIKTCPWTKFWYCQQLH